MQTVKKRSEMLFVRGDSVIMLSPGGGDKKQREEHESLGYTDIAEGNDIIT